MNQDATGKEKQERMAKWGKTRAKGAGYFIFIFGVLLWGVCTGALYAAVMAFVKRGEAGFSFWRVLWPSLILFPMGGTGWGAAMWFLNEKAYKKAGGAEKKRPDGPFAH